MRSNRSNGCVDRLLDVICKVIKNTLSASTRLFLIFFSVLHISVLMPSYIDG